MQISTTQKPAENKWTEELAITKVQSITNLSERTNELILGCHEYQSLRLSCFFNW